MVVFFVEFGEVHLCKNNVTSLLNELVPEQ
jgi:hypothetical protein